MAWHNDPAHPFAGIAEKLARSNENIRNLNEEIAAFFKGSKYPALSKEDHQEWQEAIDYHRSLPIPIRFGVLTGEIVHHLRSSLDHVAWHFSSLAYRQIAAVAIEFPIFQETPTGKRQAGYDRKIKGISNAKITSLIESLQPHHRGIDAIDQPLCIVHDMDRFDKHRELAIISSCVNMHIPGATLADIIAAISHGNGEPLSHPERKAAERTLNADIKIAPQVAFVQFGKRKTQPVVPSLQQLQNFIATVIDRFAAEV